MARQARETRAASALPAFILLAAALVCGPAAASKEVKRGERIFMGREAVVARMYGHDKPLSPELGRCANCHRPQASAGKGLQENIAPPLDRAYLTEARGRRGAGPSAYDRGNFCATIRSGIDPQYVMMKRAMPRFEMTDAQCAALWAYLTEKK